MPIAPAFHLRPLSPDDRERVSRLVRDHWGAAFVVSRGVIHYPERLPGFLALMDETEIGLVTYHIAGDSCEIVTLDSLRPNCGIGSALIQAVKVVAQQARCRRLWLITTNDNLHAQGFYQRRGFRLVAVHPDALEQTRKLKPNLPSIGLNGIPLRDEVELALGLGG